MAFTRFDDPGGLDRMREFMGPGMVDGSVRQAIQSARMALPKEKRSADEVEKVVRHLVKRSLADLREDSDLFGLGR